MKRKSVGYFDGTDPGVLTTLICDGHDATPYTNGVENYGKHVRLINEETDIPLPAENLAVGGAEYVNSLAGVIESRRELETVSYEEGSTTR